MQMVKSIQKSHSQSPKGTFFFLIPGKSTKFLIKLVWKEIFQTSHISHFFCLNFENLTVEFHVLYIFNMHIKFLSNWILFTI